VRDPGGTYTSEWVTLAYAPTGTAGIKAARCERRRVGVGAGGGKVRRARTSPKNTMGAERAAAAQDGRAFNPYIRLRPEGGAVAVDTFVILIPKRYERAEDWACLS